MSEARVAELEKQVEVLTKAVKTMWDFFAPSYKWEDPWQQKEKPIYIPEPLPAFEDLAKLPEYEYSVLSVPKSEIRVLEFIDAEDPTAPVSCSIKKVSLDEAKDVKNLVPLSYTWGTLERTERIFLDKRPFKVTKNLYAAMQHFRNNGKDCLDVTGVWKRYPQKADAMRRMTGSPIWWIDAICVNQNDLDERSSQVALMTRLYRSAKLVCVWLGEEADDSARGMDMIRRIFEESKDRNWVREPGKLVRHMGPGTVPEVLNTDPREFERSEKDRNYAAVVKIYSRPWCSRVWIRQEIALPAHVKVYCGNEECSWDQLMTTASLLSFLADEYRIEDMHRIPLVDQGALTSCFQRAESLAHLRNETRLALSQRGIGAQAYRKPYLSFLAAAFQARASHSTDARDKIYAMLPFVNPDETNIIADYRKTYQEVCKAFAMDLASTTLDFFAACQHSSATTPGLPSWAPDFARSWDFWPFLLTFDIGRPFKANEKNTDFRLGAPEVSFPPETSILRAKGYLFDSIDNISNDQASITSSNEQIRQLRQSWWDFFLQERLPYPKRANYSTDYYGDSIRKIWDWRQMMPYQLLAQLRGSDSIHFQPFNRNLHYMHHKPREIGLGHTERTAMQVAQHYFMTEPYGKQLEESEELGKARALLAGRKFGKTSLGAFGLLPAAVAPGDRLCQFRGSALTYVVRETKPNHWSLIGDAWFLYGTEPFVKGDALQLEDIALV